MQHVWFGTIFGEDGKAIGTRCGNPIKLKGLLNEIKSHALDIVNEKGKGLSNAEKQHISDVFGIDPVKYIELLPNHTNDCVFLGQKCYHLTEILLLIYCMS
jgi:arginyl-tRNA synthetase